MASVVKSANFPLFLLEFGLKPSTERPSSVKVPVLSNTKVSICPAMLIRCGEIQKIDFFLSRFRANTIPQDIAAGNAGGTETVIRSRQRSISIPVGTPSFN